jgi:hypothetical protein
MTTTTLPRYAVWSVRELQDAHDRTGGTVTAQPATREASDGTRIHVIELIITADDSAITTDWDPTDEPYGWDLPVVRNAIAAMRATA